FILPQSLEVMNEELKNKIDKVYMSNKSINSYLYSKDDPLLPKSHPKRIFMERDNGYLNSDLFEKNSEMKFLYEQDELLKFISACLGVSPIYRWADPLACHAYNVMKPEGVLPWHFDSCEFTLSLMIQKPEKGGIFEYCPFIREPGNENFDEVKKVLDGDRTRVRQLKLEPGDLQIFKGRFTLHRVTKVEGNKPRYLCIPAYVLDPWRVNTPEHSEAIYGKVLPIHIERNKPRSDGLTD
ncbi:hypothetical protein N9S28_01620, partial [Candidatus Pelagibacter sp.]|nr:hypothetical protein [Candidatus Pelagibacter sp.]